MNLKSTFAVLYVVLASQMAQARDHHFSLDFLVYQEAIYLVGADSNTTVGECRRLAEYSRLHAQRNSKSFSLTEKHCQIYSHPQPIFERGTVPSYSYHRDQKAHRASLTTAIDVSRLLPEAVWKYTDNRPRDGVCFNSALVDSGLLPETDRSVAIRSVQYLLGLNRVNWDVKSSSLIIGPASDSPAVKNRYLFEVSDRTRDSVKSQIDEILASGSSAGSILCIDAQAPQRADAFASQFRKNSSDIEISSVSDLEYLENKGGHCLTFMTPNLIVDSNQFLPYNLSNWSLAFEMYADLVQSFNTPGTFFLFELEPDRRKFSSWYDKQISKDHRLDELRLVTQKHRNFYEKLSVESCNGTEQKNLYSPSCLRENDDLKEKLLGFWHSGPLETLQQSQYKEFWQMRSDGGISPSSPTGLAFDIFLELIYLVEQLEKFGGDGN